MPAAALGLPQAVQRRATPYIPQPPDCSASQLPEVRPVVSSLPVARPVGSADFVTSPAPRQRRLLRRPKACCNKRGGRPAHLAPEFLHAIAPYPSQPRCLHAVECVAHRRRERPRHSSPPPAKHSHTAPPRRVYIANPD